MLVSKLASLYVQIQSQPITDVLTLRLNGSGFPYCYLHRIITYLIVKTEAQETHTHTHKFLLI